MKEKIIDKDYNSDLSDLLKNMLASFFSMEKTEENLINNINLFNKNWKKFFRKISDGFSENFAGFDNSDVVSILNNSTNFKEKFYNPEFIGKFNLNDDEDLLSFSIRCKTELNEKSGKKIQYELAKKILRTTQVENICGAIFIFFDNNFNFRFSLIYDKPIGTGVRWSNFRRYTYFVSKDQTNRTFIEQLSNASFSSLDSLIEAFSVEKVTKEFYQEIADWYFWAQDGDKIFFPADYKYSDNAKKDKELRNATSLIRLITRIIFIWFLKEKGLVPENLFDKAFMSDIVKDFNISKDSSNYYNAILQNLFFATLNQKMNERKFAKEGNFNENKKEYGVKTLFRYANKFNISEEEVLKLFQDIPFLNGGLFDCLDKEDEKGKVVYIDGFSRNPSKQAMIPDYVFFQEKEEAVDLSKFEIEGIRKVRGLIEILKSYNFTTDENTTYDQEIALDPELLGKVFENLLAAYNPETSSTARKATGSYYTPREIVEYMVDESLKNYFQTHTNLSLETIEKLIVYSDEAPELSIEQKKVIIELIDNIKILDPACGSGAFPMGILHKLVFILEKLDPENKYWYELQYNKALKETEHVFEKKDKEEREILLKEINDTFDERINYPDYARKLYLIENCIYGVDIQPIAIQISKLRFFISLILDQKIDKTKENYGIKALPNLETKFLAANTLISIDKNEIYLYPENIGDIEDQIKHLRHLYFEAKTRDEKRKFQEKDKELREKLSNELLILGYSTESSKKISNFNPYDPNASAEWFDPEWMFGVRDGFDIVIGNPPYGIDFNNTEIEYFKNNYQTAKTKNKIKGSLDSFSLFIEKGFVLLKKNGYLSFIVPLSVISSDSMGALHTLLETNCKEIKVCSFAVRPKPIFQNAVVDVSIISFLKTFTPCEHIFCTKLYRKGKGFNLSEIIKKLEFIDVKEYKLTGRYPKISYSIEKNILRKLFNIKTRVKDLICSDGESIYYRAAGGRYFKVITPYKTHSSAEKQIKLNKKFSNTVGLFLSSNLFFWYYQIFSDNHNLKAYDLETFPIPIERITDSIIMESEKLYKEYLDDIERNSNIRSGKNYANIESFKEYKIVKSKHIIDKIDDLIGPLYGLTKEEIEFIKNYEIEFRLSGLNED